MDFVDSEFETDAAVTDEVIGVCDGEIEEGLGDGDGGVV